MILLFLYIIAALYLLYAKLEEEHGLARHAMSVYERATDAVLPEERFDDKMRLFPNKFRRNGSLRCS